ncbi:hypothetical protein N8584_01555 [bacterium]|nr:hypothetical protein [bacterium]
MLLVWGDGYSDGFLGMEIFSKKRLKVLETWMFVKFIEVEIINPYAQNSSLAEKLDYLREY